MQLSTGNRLLGVPISHAVFLAGWSLLQPERGPHALWYWAVWPLFLLLFFDRRITLLVSLAATPFLAVAAYQWR